MGRRDQFRRPATAGRCASSFSPTPATGSTSIISTGCGSTRRSRFSTPRDDHILAAIVRRVREAARRPQHLCRRRERAAGRPPGAAAGARRLRARRAVERRFPPQRDGRADRPARGLLHRLPRRAGRVRRRREIRLSVSGPALRLAEEAARHAGARPAGRDAHRLSAEPRPGREQRSPGCACTS